MKGNLVSFRQKANQTLAKGAAERRNWSPSPEEAHYRIYRWWMGRSDKHPARENFCHYWRVVLIWAPLRLMAKPLLYVLVAAILAGAVWLAIQFTSVAMGVAGYAYVVCGFFVGKQLMHDLHAPEFKVNAVPWIKDQSVTVRALLIFIASPVIIAIGAVMLIVLALVLMLVGLQEDYSLYSRAWQWFSGTTISKRKSLSWVRPWSVLALAAVASLVVFSVVNPLIREIVAYIAFALLAIAAAIGGIMLASWATDTAKKKGVERRAQRARISRMATVDMLMMIMFEEIHPDRRSNQQSFESWRRRYMKYCESRFDKPVYSLDDWQLLERLRQPVHTRVRSRTYALLHPVRKAKEPSRAAMWIKNSLRNTGDILSLIWSVVLTKKWKICPLVDIPEAA